MTPYIGGPDETGLDPTATIPKPFWKRAEIDVRKLFEGLTRGFRNWTVKDYQLLPRDLAKVVSSVSVKEAPAPELAWALVYSALAHAMVKNTRAIVAEFSFSKDEDPKTFAEALKLPGFEGAIQFSPSFMENPAGAPFFLVIRTAYQDWLSGAGLPSADAALVAGRLGTAFTFALHREWLENAGKYAPLLDWLDSPFAKAVDKERRWLAYYAWLETQLDESIFGQSYGLRDLYIPLNAYYEVKQGTSLAEDRLAPQNSCEADFRKVVALENHLLEWLEEPQPKYSMLLISGGPGSGKSSFLKHFATTLGQARKPVVLIPLQYFGYRQDLGDALKQFIHDHHTLKGAADAANGDELIILFDGLDELSMAGTHGEEAARSFVAALKEYLYRTNHPQCRVRAILSGRELAIQSDRNLQRDEGRVLYLLPYFTPNEERDPQTAGEKWRYDDPNGVLDRDYRREWWEKFHRLLGIDDREAPQALLETPFDDLTNQPLLNVLIAISITGKQSGTLQIDADTNLNEVYAHLLHRVWERNDEKAENRGTPRIKEDKFNAALEAVAVVTWHGNGRTANAKAIADQCGQQLLNAFSDQAEKSVYSLLVGFFFHDRGQNDTGQTVYEFTHKSFGEYLTARSLVKILRNLMADFELWKEGDGRGNDLVKCLVAWTEHCGPAKIDEYLLPFIQRELALQCVTSKINAQEARSFIVAMMNHTLKAGLPIEKTCFSSNAFHAQCTYARNAELALLLCVAALPWAEEETAREIPLDWPDATAAGNWLNRLRMQRISDYQQSLALAALSGVSLSGQCLEYQDLSFAFLYRANLEGASLYGANLEIASLSGANLYCANLLLANLYCATLNETNLTGANLFRANLQSASLQSANLNGADLTGAYLTGANLTEATLEGVENWEQIADISNCNITRVRNAPDGFMEWALDHGAVQKES